MTTLLVDAQAGHLLLDIALALVTMRYVKYNAHSLTAADIADQPQCCVSGSTPPSSGTGSPGLDISGTPSSSFWSCAAGSYDVVAIEGYIQGCAQVNIYLPFVDSHLTYASREAKLALTLYRITMPPKLLGSAVSMRICSLAQARNRQV